VENCLPWDGPHVGAEESVRSPPPEEEGAAETMCNKRNVTPIPRPPAPVGGRRERNGSEVEPGKKGGVGGRSFKISFISHCPT